MNTGLRSQEFEFLLEEGYNEDTVSRQARRDNFQQYILELSGGQIGKDEIQKKQDQLQKGIADKVSK